MNEYLLPRDNKPEFYAGLQNVLSGAGYESNLRNVMAGASGPQNTTIYNAATIPWNVQGFYIPPTMPSENVSSLIASGGYQRPFPEAANAQPGDLFSAANAAGHELLHRAAYGPLMRDEGVQSVLNEAFREIGASSRTTAEGVNRGGTAASELFAYMFEPEASGVFMQNPEAYARMLRMDRVPSREEIADVRRRYLPRLEAALAAAARRRSDPKIEQRINQMPRRGQEVP